MIGCSEKKPPFSLFSNAPRIMETFLNEDLAFTERPGIQPSAADGLLLSGRTSAIVVIPRAPLRRWQSLQAEAVEPGASTQQEVERVERNQPQQAEQPDQRNQPDQQDPQDPQDTATSSTFGCIWSRRVWRALQKVLAGSIDDFR